MAPFLEGALVKIGLAVQGLAMNIETEDQIVKASMTTNGSTSPYYSLGLNKGFTDSPTSVMALELATLIPMLWSKRLPTMTIQSMPI